MPGLRVDSTVQAAITVGLLRTAQLVRAGLPVAIVLAELREQPIAPVAARLGPLRLVALLVAVAVPAVAAVTQAVEDMPARLIAAADMADTENRRIRITVEGKGGPAGASLLFAQNFLSLIPCYSPAALVL